MKSVSLRLIRSLKTLQVLLDSRRARGERIGFVPTMGALHAGHAALIRRSVAECDFTVVSIYVNPLQFGPHEDYARYPRVLKADAALCRRSGADVVFAPEHRSVRSHPALKIRKADPGLQRGMCGRFRPGHFDGVAGIVGFFFELIRPHKAYFGLKDYQQFLIVKKLAQDEFPRIRVAGVATQRAADGLALSSRNAYLTASERRSAPKIYRILSGAARRIRSAAKRPPPAAFVRHTASRLRMISGVDRVEYVELARAEDLKPIRRRWPVKGRAVLGTALSVGKTRLIDHVLI